MMVHSPKNGNNDKKVQPEVSGCSEANENGSTRTYRWRGTQLTEIIFNNIVFITININFEILLLITKLFKREVDQSCERMLWVSYLRLYIQFIFIMMIAFDG